MRRLLLVFLVLCLTIGPAAAIPLCSEDNQIDVACRFITPATNCTSYELVSSTGSNTSGSLTVLYDSLSYADINPGNGSYSLLLCDGQSTQLTFGGESTMISNSLTSLGLTFTYIAENLLWIVFLALGLYRFTPKHVRVILLLMAAFVNIFIAMMIQGPITSISTVHWCLTTIFGIMALLYYKFG